MSSTYTRVYTEGGTVAHLLDEWDSPNRLGAEALCGRSAWPSFWHGTGSQAEHEKAEDLRGCVACLGVVRHRRGS